MPQTFRVSYALLAAAVFSVCAPAFAASQSFKDVPPGDFAYDAVEYLKQKNILTGYSDGTFREDNAVNRAEALKFIATQVIPDEALAKYKTSNYTDVSTSDWFLPYVEWAREQGIIKSSDTPIAFRPGSTVTKAEFIKMFLASRKIDPKAFGDITLGFSKDIPDDKDWSYPYMRYAIASSMTTASSSGLYSPARDLTRGDVAVLMHRYFLYKLGQRSQELLSQTEKELAKTIDALAAHNETAAGYTSGRALLMMRGAHEVRPQEAMVNAVLKVTEGYRSLVRAFVASEKSDWKTVQKLSSDAWYSGDQAKKIAPQSASVANQLQQYAQSFASEARK